MIKRIVFIKLLSMLIVCSYGQGTNRDYNEEVTIRGSYDPTINQAFKINSKPETFSITLKNPEFSFESIEVDQPTQVVLKPIEAARIRTTRKAKVYKNYLKAGIGSWISPFVDFAHSSGTKDAVFNAGLYHLSSFRNIADYAASPFSNTKVSAGWKKLMDNHVFSIGLNYGLNTYRYYGYKPEEFPSFNIDEDDLKQTFNLVKLDLGLKSQYKKESKLHHAFNISAYYYFDKHNTSESNANFNFDLYKAFSLTELLNYQHLGLQGKISYYGNNDSVRNTTDIFIEGTPYFKAKYGIVNFLLGLKFAYLSSDESVFAFNPVLIADLNVVPEALTLYAGIDGGLEKNSFLRLTTTNPWFTGFYEFSQMDSTFTWQQNKFAVHGGIRGNISNQLGFNIQVRYLLFNNMGFFVNTPIVNIWGPIPPSNKFTVFYDDGNLFTFSGELTYQFGHDIKLWVNGEYNMYSLDSLSQPSHKPVSVFGLGGSWLIKKKVNIGVEAFYSVDRYAISIVNTQLISTFNETTLDGFIDLNLSLSYNISDNFSVWLSGTNLLNNNYQVFLNYPVHGLEIMGGIGVRF